MKVRKKQLLLAAGIIWGFAGINILRIDQFPNHHSRFDMDEKALESGVKLMLAYVMEE